MTTPSSRSFTVKTEQYNGPSIVIGPGNGQPRVVAFPPKGSAIEDAYWVTIWDRQDVAAPVANAVYPAKDNTTVPAELAKYNDQAQYFFCFVTKAMLTPHVPQGALFDFLLYNGAGYQLRRQEQLNADIGCGSLAYMNYLLVNVFRDDDQSGFEDGNLDSFMYTTFELRALDIGGKIWYEPGFLP